MAFLNRKTAFCSLVLASGLFAPRGVMAYQVLCSTVAVLNTGLPIASWPQPIPFSVTKIFSVFGEARPSGSATNPYVGVPQRFHMGTDVGNNCAQGHDVGAIYGGTVIEIKGNVPGCAVGANCIRIQDSAGHAFDYIHVIPAPNNNISVGVVVNAGQAIGTIDAANHLHLDDVNLAASMKVNPETNGLEFSDSDTPHWDTITVGGIISSLIPVDANTAQPLILSAQIVSPPSFILPASEPPVGVYVTGRDGSKRKGLYSVSIGISNFASPPLNLYSNILQFDDLNDLNSSAGANVVYLQRNLNSDTWQGTTGWGSLANTSLGLGQAQAAPVDLSNASVYPDGNYQLCATLVSLQAPGSKASLDANCVGIILDRTPPGLTVFDSSGLQIATGTYTKTPSISVQVNDALSGPGGVEVDDNGVFIASTAASFPPPSYAYTSSNLPVLGNIPEGNVQITGYDQAGNATTTNFIVDHTPPLSVVLSPKDASSMPALQLPGFVISGTAEEGCIKEA